MLRVATIRLGVLVSLLQRYRLALGWMGSREEPDCQATGCPEDVDLVGTLWQGCMTRPHD